MKITLGLGSNQGDRFAALKNAITLLQPHVKQMTLSSIYESPALLLPNSPPEWNVNFLNMVISGETTLPPEDFLVEIKKIEKQMGRSENYAKWSPRIIDIDILIYGNTPYQSDTLTIPHPLIHERAFVILPLAELGYSFITTATNTTTRIGYFL